MFDDPSFTFWNVVYTSIGTAVFWGKWGRKKLKAYYLSDLIERLPLEKRYRQILEFVVFVSIGCVVGVGLVEPRNAVQALTAGFGWTGAFLRYR